jgi:uncharacterized protein (DUF305 family)
LEWRAIFAVILLVPLAMPRQEMQMRLTHLSLILALAMAPTLVRADDAMKGMDMKGMDMKGADKSQSPADKAYSAAMQKMMADTSATALTGDPDRDFVLMMEPHHQAAVEMAQAYLKYGNDPVLKKMAKAIIASQTQEIGEMKQWQAKHGH